MRPERRRQLVATFVLACVSAVSFVVLRSLMEDRPDWAVGIFSLGWPFAVATAALCLTSLLGRLDLLHGIGIIATSLGTAALCGPAIGISGVMMLFSGAAALAVAVGTLLSGEAGAGDLFFMGGMALCVSLVFLACFWLGGYALDRGWRLVRHTD